MDKKMDKYQNAIANYVIAKNNVSALTHNISWHLQCCIEKNYGANADENSRTCMDKAYAYLKNAELPEYHTAEDYIRYEANGCEFCLAAHNLVQQRRIARRNFGFAKASITKFGNHLLFEKNEAK